MKQKSTLPKGRADFYLYGFGKQIGQPNEKAKTVGSGVYKITYKVTRSWSDYVDNLKKFVTARNAFFSDNLTVTAPESGAITGNTTLIKDETLTLTANTTANSYQWQSSSDGSTWTDIAGATEKIYSATATVAMDGLSIRCVTKNVGNTVNTTRVAKATTAAATVLPPVTLTMDWEKSVACQVEVNDFIVGWDLVLVYTNDEVPGFTYDGALLYDVSDLGYKFGTVWNQNGTAVVTPGTGYTYVYGLIVHGDADADKVAPSGKTAAVLDRSNSKDRYDVNNSNTVDINDFVAVAAVYNVNDEYLNEERMSVVLLADVSGNKMVDTYDCSLIKSNGSVEDF